MHVRPLSHQATSNMQSLRAPISQAGQTRIASQQPQNFTPCVRRCASNSWRSCSSSCNSTSSNSRPGAPKESASGSEGVTRRSTFGVPAAVLAVLATASSSWQANADMTALPPVTARISKTSLITLADLPNTSPTERQIYGLNKRIQTSARVPKEFPGFIVEGFSIKVVGDGYTMNEKGLIYKDFVVGSGFLPLDGQELIFQYTGYNESGLVIDSSYKNDRPAQTRLGVNGLIPGFEEGIRTMKVGGKRRIIVPPELGPPTGPATFFSAKQCEVFDIELFEIRTCERRQVLMFSDVVCT